MGQPATVEEGKANDNNSRNLCIPGAHRSSLTDLPNTPRKDCLTSASASLFAASRSQARNLLQTSSDSCSSSLSSSDISSSSNCPSSCSASSSLCAANQDGFRKTDKTGVPDILCSFHNRTRNPEQLGAHRSERGKTESFPDPACHTAREHE